MSCCDTALSPTVTARVGPAGQHPEILNHGLFALDHDRDAAFEVRRKDGKPKGLQQTDH